MPDKTEVWKDAFFENIKTCERFQLSSRGRLRKFDAETEKYQPVKTNLVTGYHTFYVKRENGKRAIKYLHRTLAEVFIERRDEQQNVVIHLDHDKENNTVENLKWADRHEHMLHQKSNPKVTHKGRKHGYKISPKDVKEIFQLVEEGESKASIARKFRISSTQVRRILDRKNWNDVDISGQG